MSLLKWGENASRGCRGVFHRGTASAALEGPGLIVSADLSLPLERWRDHLIVWLSAVRSVTPALKNSNELINWQLLCFYPRLGLHSQHLSAARRQRCIVSSSLEMQVKQQALHQLAALYLKTLRKKKSRTNLADWLVACSCKFSSSLILFFLCLFYPHKVCETHFSFLTHSCPVPPPRSASRSSLPCETLNKNCFYIVSWHFLWFCGHLTTAAGRQITDDTWAAQRESEAERRLSPTVCFWTELMWFRLKLEMKEDGHQSVFSLEHQTFRGRRCFNTYSSYNKEQKCQKGEMKPPETLERCKKGSVV